MNWEYSKLYISLALLSISVIGYQLTLIQVLSIQQWHYMAFLIISVALLAFGASGIILAIFKDQILNNYSQIYSILLISTCITMLLAPILTGSSWLQFDTYLVFTDYRHIIRLAFTCLLYFIPFLCSAIAIGMTFTKYSDKIGRLYFSNLLGSGIGGIVTVGLMWKFLPHHLPITNAIFPLVGYIIYSKINTLLHKITLTGALCLIIACIIFAPEFKPSQYKSWSKTINLPKSKAETIRNTPYGLVQTVSSPVIRYAPSVSLQNTKSIPQARMVFVNGEAVGYIPSDSVDNSFLILDSSPIALTYYLGYRNKSLILKSGLGEHVFMALNNQSKHITAVEMNPTLINMSNYQINKVNHNSYIYFKNTTTRSFLKQDTTLYDAIVFPITGSFYGTTGLYAIEEQNWLTIEAFNDVWKRLNNNGALCISCWLDYPYRTPLKLVATIDEMLKQQVDSTYNHLIGIKNWNLLTLIVKRTPFSDFEINRTKYFCDSLLFDPIFFNQHDKLQNNILHQSTDTLFSSFLKELTGFEKEKFYKSYPFRINPATDNKPYFSQFLKPGSISEIYKNYNLNSVPYFELGYLIAIITVILVLILGVLFILTPLVLIKHTKTQYNTLIYFASIGMGYMFTEMILIHQFNIYFGNPVYSVAIVICALLMSSGLGSFYSKKIIPLNKIWIAPLSISVILIIFIIFLPNFISVSLPLTYPYKIIFSVIAIGILGFFMGIPFPIAISKLALQSNNKIPAAWAINGFFSVIATPLAIILSIEVGFSGLFKFSVFCYLLASSMFFKIFK